MASKEQIKAAILKVAGDPGVGVIFELADEMADAIVAIDKPVIERRIVKPQETR
jgi:hypothetical protein